jgi:shikimate dehydrogenase
MTRQFAVLGSPIEHSPSPKIHNFAFEARGVDASYGRFDVGSQLQEFLASKPDYQGFSVTMPLKDEAFALSTWRSPVATITKSVNTLLRVGDSFHGFNTDVMGVQNAIGFEPDSLAVLGSGATARSALAAFPRAKKVMFARNPETSAALANEFGAALVEFDEAVSAEVVISTLPPGALPTLAADTKIPGTLLDVAYTNPVVDCGRHVSGLLMLIHQAIGQQRIFNFGDDEKTIENEPELLESLLRLLSMAK